MKRSDQLEIFGLNKESHFNFRSRRHPEWIENYTLYRDRVILNRLTQRQSVNIPLMKASIMTLLKDIDEPPLLYFENLDGIDDKEVYYNEYWKKAAKENKLTIKDIVDKKQAMLYGRTFKKLNIYNGFFFTEIVDGMDMLVDRYIDPTRLDSTRSLIHEHIYLPLSSLRWINHFDQKAVTRLMTYYATEQGMKEIEENMEDMIDRNARLEAMGVPDLNDPILGESYVELNEMYMYQYDPNYCDEEVIFLTVTASMSDENEILFYAPLEEVLGETEDHYWRNHYPFTSWGGDMERTDFWSDGVGDILRMPNKIINSWFSQDVENRTLANFGMHYYDSSNKDFVPQTFTPVPWGWYPTPGDPNKTVKKVEVQPLNGNLEGIQFIMGIAEKAVAATSTNQGQVEQKQVTLGEVQLAYQNAQERVKSMAVFYEDSWEEFGQKYIKLLEGSGHLLEGYTVHKKGRQTGQRSYAKFITPEMWLSKSGYKIEIKQQRDKTAEDVQAIQKLQASRQFFVNNPVYDAILQKKAAEFAGLTTEEIQRVLDFERQKAMNPMSVVPGLPQGNGQPTLLPAGNGTATGTPPQIPAMAGA